MSLKKPFLYAFAVLIAAGLLTKSYIAQPMYVIGILIDEDQTKFYISFYSEDNTKPELTELTTEKSFGEAMDEYNALDISHVRCVYISDSCSTDRIGSFLSKSHDIMPLSVPIVRIAPETLEIEGLRGLEAPFLIPEKINEKGKTTIFQYMNGASLPSVVFENDCFCLNS